MKLFHFVALLALGAFFVPGESQAACTDVAGSGTNVWATVNELGDRILFTGACTEDDEILIQTNDISRYSECSLMSTTGAVDVMVSLDGTTYTTTTLSLIDFGASDTAPVKVTAALRMYAFPIVAFRIIRVMENGATDAAAHLACR